MQLPFKDTLDKPVNSSVFIQCNFFTCLIFPSLPLRHFPPQSHHMTISPLCLGTDSMLEFAGGSANRATELRGLWACPCSSNSGSNVVKMRGRTLLKKNPLNSKFLEEVTEM